MYTTNPLYVEEQKHVDHSDDTYHGSKEEAQPTEGRYIHAW